MNNRYKVVEGLDGIFWIPIQPLLMDISDQLQNPNLAECTIHPLRIVETFMKALLQEGTVNKYVQQNNT